MAGPFKMISMKAIVTMVIALFFFQQGLTAQVMDVESIKRNPNNTMPPNRSVPRDSSVLIIFDNKLYNSWDPAIWKLMNTTLLDTARYEMTIYGNSKSSTPVKNILVFHEKRKP